MGDLRFRSSRGIIIIIFPIFTHSITARTEAEDFDARVTVLLQEILRITGADPLPPDAMGFLVQETKTYFVNMAHTVLFFLFAGPAPSGGFRGGEVPEEGRLVAPASDQEGAGAKGVRASRF